jgi:NADH-quinone oxidoreductase subunit G
MRILPRLNEDVNEEWISDKTRFVWDGLRTQRLDRPYLKRDGRLAPVDWRTALSAVAERIRGTRPERIGAIAGDLQSAEEMYALKDLMTRLGVDSVDCRQDGTVLDPADGRASYLFNATIAGLEEADAILVVGANPRWEASLVNARIRKRWRAEPTAIGLVGEPADLTYDHAYLGAGPRTLEEIANGTHSFAETLKAAERPVVILGQGALARPDGKAIQSLAARIARDSGALTEDWNGFSVLHTAAGRVGGLDVGCVPGPDGRDAEGILAGVEAGEIDVVVLMGADEIDTRRLEGAFVVYVGTHGDRGAHAADAILPGAAYTEKPATWVNTEGRPQLGLRAGFPPGEAREDWAILRALSAMVGAQLPYDSFRALRAAMTEAFPVLGETDVVVDPGIEAVAALAKRGGAVADAPFASPVRDFYLTNPVARASAVMAECSRTIGKGRTAEAAE